MTCRFTEGEEIVHSFFSLALDEGEWPGSYTRPFTTLKRTLGSHWVFRLIWTSSREEKNTSPLLGVESRIFRPLAQSLYRLDPCDWYSKFNFSRHRTQIVSPLLTQLVALLSYMYQHMHVNCSHKWLHVQCTEWIIIHLWHRLFWELCNVQIESKY